MTFIALDVETANADMASICQIGIAKRGGPKDLDRKQGAISDTLPGSRYAASR